MARIEYLINNPYEVELSDLELLDAEIEKYPYFYSLRAIKLLAFKKFNHPDFEQELQLTSVLNSNPEELYQFLHPEEFLVPSNVTATENAEIHEQTEPVLTASTPVSTELPAPIIDPANSVTEENFQDVIEKETTLSEVTSSSEENEMVEDPHTEIVMDSSPSLQALDNSNAEEVIEKEANKIDVETSESEPFEYDASTELELSVIQDELEKEFLHQTIDFPETNTILTEETDNSITDISSVETLDEVETNYSPLTENNFISAENISTESDVTLSKLETFDIEASQVENSVVLAEDVVSEAVDITPVRDVDTTDFSIENSIEVANDILEKDTMIAQAVEETKEIYDAPIEQVELVNRSAETVEHRTDFTPTAPVSTYNTFQILNPKDEIMGGFGYEEEHVDPTNLVDESAPIEVATSLELEEPTFNEDKILAAESIQEVQNIQDELEITESVSVEDEKENAAPISASTTAATGESFSFNEWLKIPQQQQTITASSEKEMKFQIIEEFLDKNPKIKPLKKIEVPEHKAEVRDLKQTDFSDLMTETLAQIYIEQKQYEKAIKAYKILILKYPEKNSLFANQIKEIENLKNSK